MLDGEGEPKIVDIIRSMKSYGYSQGEIYDVVTGAGAPGEEIQILMDRIESDFEDAEFESRTSRITEEVGEIFEEELEAFKLEIGSTLRSLEGNIKDLRNEQRILEDFLLDMRKICVKNCERNEG